MLLPLRFVAQRLKIGGTQKSVERSASFFVCSLSALGLSRASSPLFATATTAASGGYREELLGQRPAGCECRPRHEADAGCRNPSGPAHRNRCDLAALNTRHLLRKPVCGLKAPLGLSRPPGTAVLSGSLLCGKRNISSTTFYFSTFRLCRVENSFAGCSLRLSLRHLPFSGTGS